jgi:hypothetical protein
MIRRIAFVSIPVVIALGAWLLLRNNDGDPAPVAPPPVEKPAAQSEAASAVEVTKDVVPAPAEAAVVRTSVASESTQPPIPDDAKWLDVLVVDAATQQPIADAEVRWMTSATYAQVQALPEKERPALYNDQELVARRFGWTTHSNATGIARIAGDANGANVYGYSEGRYGNSYFGGQRPLPNGGWRLELVPDKTLRAQVLDFANQIAVGVPVRIHRYDTTGTEKTNWVGIQHQTTAAPDGIAEFKHIQVWPNKAEIEVASWQVAFEIPGYGGAGTEFAPNNPPSEPIVLQMPATGRLTARLLHKGQPLTRGVTFSAYVGKPGDSYQWNTAPQLPVDGDGWARFPHVALGGSLNVLARVGAASVDQAAEAPTSNGQEVRAELTTDELYVLTGRLLGPDGKLLTDASVSANFDMDIMSGGGQIETDSQGRFVWLTTKGYKEATRIKHLVLSQSPVGSSPLRVSVPPRDIVRGINDLGDLQLTTGPLIVAGSFESDSSDTPLQLQFTIQRLSEQRERNGAERWNAVDGVTIAQQPDHTFEVRGETQVGRHRIFFPGYGHLPIKPIEFAIGTKDLVIPVMLGSQLTATCIPPEELPANRLRGVLKPNGEVPAEPDPGRWGSGFDRYTATPWGGSDPAQMRWNALPAGSYTLELGTLGVASSLLAIPDVVVPQPKDGDPRLQNIDLRGKINTLKVQVTLRPKATEQNRTPIVFPMPQANEKEWLGLQVREGELVIPTPPGQTELLIACDGYKPQRILAAEREVKVTLEPWPSVELLLANLPELPMGVTLGVILHNRESAKQYRDMRFSTENQGGGIESLLALPYSSNEVKEGRATVQIGDGSYSISAYLRSKEGGRTQALKSLTPKEIQGGPNLAPITVQWSEDELRAALEELQKAPEKK